MLINHLNKPVVNEHNFIRKVDNNMKNLSDFTVFDFIGFSKGKTYAFISALPWQEKGTSKLLGTTVECVVLEDNTKYREGRKGTNKYEKIRFKVKDKQLNFAPDTIVSPVNVVAKVYGDYNNMLSCVCDDLLPVEKKV